MLKKIYTLTIKRYGKPIFGLFAIMGLRRVNARMAIVSRDNHILLIETNFHDELILPGGAVDEYGEQPIDAALRELGEEVSLSDKHSNNPILIDKSCVSCVGCYLLGKKRLQHRHIFYARLDIDAADISAVRVDTIEVRSVGWYDLANIETVSLTDELKHFLVQELPQHIGSGRQFVRRWLDIPHRG